MMHHYTQLVHDSVRIHPRGSRTGAPRARSIVAAFAVSARGRYVQEGGKVSMVNQFQLQNTLKNYKEQPRRLCRIKRKLLPMPIPRLSASDACCYLAPDSRRNLAKLSIVKIARIKKHNMCSSSFFILLRQLRHADF